MRADVCVCACVRACVRACMREVAYAGGLVRNGISMRDRVCGWPRP